MYTNELSLVDFKCGFKHGFAIVLPWFCHSFVTVLSQFSYGLVMVGPSCGHDQDVV